MIKTNLKRYLTEQLAFLLVISMLLNGFFSVFTVSHEQILNFKNLEQQVNMFGEKVLICTSDGYEWKTWQEIADQEKSSNPYKTSKCKDCTSSHGGKDTLLPEVTEIAQILTMKSDVSLPLYRELHGVRLSHAPPRSPPQFS